jgi:hypothetical protein
MIHKYFQSIGQPISNAWRRSKQNSLTGATAPANGEGRQVCGLGLPSQRLHVVKFKFACELQNRQMGNLRAITHAEPSLAAFDLLGRQNKQKSSTERPFAMERTEETLNETQKLNEGVAVQANELPAATVGDKEP